MRAWQAWWAREQEQFRQHGITDQELTEDTAAGAIDKVFGHNVQITEWAKADDDG